MFHVHTLDPAPVPPVRDRHVLVGVDSSETALEAALWAAREAELREVTLVLATGADRDVATATGLNPGFSESFYDYLQSKSLSAINGAADAVSARYPDLRIEKVFGWNRPSRLLSFLSRAAELTVVGETGAGVLSRLLVGATALEVVSEAQSPVAIIRGASTSEVADRSVVVGLDGSQLSADAAKTAFAHAALHRCGLVLVRPRLRDSRSLRDGQRPELACRAGQAQAGTGREHP